MKKWVLKAIVQKGISFLPYKHRINYLFQKYITKGVRLSPLYFEDRLLHLKHHLEFYHQYRGDLRGIKTLELGTGWYPVVPIGLFLAGAGEINTVDISALTNRENVLLTLKRYLEYESAGKLAPFFIPTPTRLEEAKRIVAIADGLDYTQLLEGLRIQYWVMDARQLPLATASIQFITSNNTFEHIYPDILKAILISFKRVIHPDGVMSHFIDMSDHFAHLDSSISIYHFLRYSNKEWKWIDNDIQPQNRWRITHYRQLYEALGIPISKEKNRPGDIEVIKKEPLAEAFKDTPIVDLAISHSYVVSVGF